MDLTRAVSNALNEKSTGLQLRLRFQNDTVRPAAMSYLTLTRDGVGGCSPPALTFLTP